MNIYEPWLLACEYSYLVKTGLYLQKFIKNALDMLSRKTSEGTQNAPRIIRSTLAVRTDVRDACLQFCGIPPLPFFLNTLIHHIPFTFLLLQKRMIVVQSWGWKQILMQSETRNSLDSVVMTVATPVRLLALYKPVCWVTWAFHADPHIWHCVFFCVCVCMRRDVWFWATNSTTPL